MFIFLGVVMLNLNTFAAQYNASSREHGKLCKELESRKLMKKKTGKLFGMSFLPYTNFELIPKVAAEATKADSCPSCGAIKGD